MEELISVRFAPGITLQEFARVGAGSRCEENARGGKFSEAKFGTGWQTFWRLGIFAWLVVVEDVANIAVSDRASLGASLSAVVLRRTICTVSVA